MLLFCVGDMTLSARGTENPAYVFPPAMLHGFMLRCCSAGLFSIKIPSFLPLILIQGATAALCKRQMESAAAISPSL